MKIQVNIARNDRVTDKPMIEPKWNTFTGDVQQCIYQSAKNGTQWIAGGIYDCFESYEESFFCLADVGYGFDKVKFQNMIYKLTEKYNQDSIAVTYIYDDSNFLIKNLNPKQ